MTSRDRVNAPGHNWGGNVAYRARTLHAPTTLEELQELVASATAIRALGSRHSFSEVADTTGDLVTTALLDVGADSANGADYEPSTAAVTVAAGAKYADIVAELDRHGRALRNLGSLPHITVGGAAATGTHGSGSAHRCLANDVVAIEYVRADGELVTIGTGEDCHPGAVLALGALGVATRMHLATIASTPMHQHVWLDAPLTSACEHFDDILDSAYSVSLFSRPGRPDVIDQMWIKALADAEPVDASMWGARPAGEAMHPAAGQDPHATTVQLGRRAAWFEVLPHFRASYRPSVGDEQQSEYLVPRAHGPDALAALQHLDLAPALQVMEVRTVAADELWLSPSRGRDCVGFHFTWDNDTPAVQRAVAHVERVLAPYAALPHWGKVFAMPPAQVRAGYDQLDRFRALADTMDPNRKFGNRFLTDYVY